MVDSGDADLDRIVAPSGDVEDHEALKKEARLFERKRREQELARGKQELEQRERYAGRVYRMIVAWLVSILAITLLQGFRGLHGFTRGRFHLSDSVVLGLIGGTTVTVLGLFVIVVRNLFPRRDTQGE